MKSRVPPLTLGLLILLYGCALFAPLVAPYSGREQFRENYLSPPSPIRFRDPTGRWTIRPHAEILDRIDETPTYRASGRLEPIVFWVEGTPYQWLWIEWKTRLFGLQDGDRPLFLLGSDALGRDLFSRILLGSRFTLTIGLVGVALTTFLGLLLGAVSGYFSGIVDSLIMRAGDLFLSLPGLFLILGIRALFPVRMGPWETYWAIVVIFSLIGWAHVARVIRGQVLSLKTREHVMAARAMGASNARILVIHILPFCANYLLIQCTVLIPSFILGEVTLSFLGLGVQEPDASWGTLLTSALSVRTFQDHRWLLAPAGLIFITVLAFNRLAEDLKVRSSERAQWW